MPEGFVGYPSQNISSVGRVRGTIKLKLGGASAPIVLSGGYLLDPTQPPTHAGGGNVIQLNFRQPWYEVVSAVGSIRDDAAAGDNINVGNIVNEGKTGPNSGATGTPGKNLTMQLLTFSGGAPINDRTYIVAVALELNNSTASYGN